MGDWINLIELIWTNTLKINRAHSIKELMRRNWTVSMNWKIRKIIIFRRLRKDSILEQIEKKILRALYFWLIWIHLSCFKFTQIIVTPSTVVSLRNSEKLSHTKFVVKITRRLYFLLTCNSKLKSDYKAFLKINFHIPKQTKKISIKTKRKKN
jgi:hypothetical protein